ncbi:hypothetical protein [Ralstonia phage RSP15]|uniref:hypothetical protein n=1 Tax=Ralstonia phage RSP15 TaxID=1785960 RepID=UPI00074D44D0|nr:hypothetical protein BH754_gp179 [Ralstonia phage RSP15]BAU40127.1 hypothetical protein [Ralstonia phage RSP15]
MDENTLIVKIHVSTDEGTYKNLSAALAVEYDGNLIDVHGVVGEEGVIDLEFLMGFEADEMDDFLDAFLDPTEAKIVGMEEFPHVITGVDYENIPDKPEFKDALLDHSIYAVDALRYANTQNDLIVDTIMQRFEEMSEHVGTITDKYASLENFVWEVKNLPHYYAALAALCKEMDMEHILDYLKQDSVH